MQAPDADLALPASAQQGSNRECIWRHQSRRGGGGDRVFMATDNAHLLALNRFTGAIAWEMEMADSRQNYSATAAPLAIAIW